METKEQTLDQAINFAKKTSRTVVGSGQEHQPVLLMFTPDGAINTLLTWVKKDNFKEIVSQLLRHFHAYAYIYINEAWATKLKSDSPLLPKILKGEVSISELPPDDRIEELIIMVAENGKSYRVWDAKIKYTPDDKRCLGEWEERKGITEGRLILMEW